MTARLFNGASAVLALWAISCGSSVDLSAPTPPAQFRASSDPTSLGEINERVSDIWVDEQRLYWEGNDDPSHESHALRSCEKDDCTNTVVTYGSSPVLKPFGVEGGEVYWLDYGDYPQCNVLLSCDVSGCSGAPRLVARLGCTSATAFTPEAAYLCGEQQLVKVPLSGAGPSSLGAPATCIAIAAQGDYVYWIGQSSAQAPFTLQRTRSDGSGSAQLLAQDIPVPPAIDSYPSPQRLTLSADSAYWTQGSLYGSIARCPLTGCVDPPELVAEPIRSPGSLLLDGTTLYFQHDTSATGLAISSLQLPHGTPSEPLARGVVAFTALATDERYLYTATSDEKLAPDGEWADPWASIRRILKTQEVAQ